MPKRPHKVMSLSEEASPEGREARRRARVDSLMVSWKAAALGLILGLLICAPFFYYINSPQGKHSRLIGMRESCAAGENAPVDCIAEGVPMKWSVE